MASIAVAAATVVEATVAAAAAAAAAATEARLCFRNGFFVRITRAAVPVARRVTLYVPPSRYTCSSSCGLIGRGDSRSHAAAEATSENPAFSQRRVAAHGVTK